MKWRNRGMEKTIRAVMAMDRREGCVMKLKSD